MATLHIEHKLLYWRTTYCNALQHTATYHKIYTKPEDQGQGRPVLMPLQQITLQHPATHCNTMRYTATHCNTRHHTATHCNTLQHTATHCNTPQHTAPRCNTLHTATHITKPRAIGRSGARPTGTNDTAFASAAVCCSVLQCVAVCCSVLQCVAVC